LIKLSSSQKNFGVIFNAPLKIPFWCLFSISFSCIVQFSRYIRCP